MSIDSEVPADPEQITLFNNSPENAGGSAGCGGLGGSADL